MPNALSRRLSRVGSLFRNGGIGELSRRAYDRFSPDGRAYRRRKREEDAAFDRTGYDTGGVQHLHALTTVGMNGASGGHHLAAPPGEFAAAMALLDLDIAGWTFVDFGSGKGRALLLAAELPFARIVGVEFARELHDIAVANFAGRAARHGPDARVELLNEDATAFRYPEESLLLFLFNPFDPPVLTEVAERAFATWTSHPRPMRVLYMNPIFPAEWARAGWRLIRSEAGCNLYAPPEG